MARVGIALAGALLVLVAVVYSSPALRKRARPTLERLGLLHPYQESARYGKILEQHRRENLELRPPCALLLGDSLSEGFPRQLAKTHGWVPRGISGDRVRDVAARIEASVLGAPCIDVALLVGSNDVIHDGASASQVASEIAALAETLRAAGKRVSITTLPPVRGGFADANDDLRAVNEKLHLLTARGFALLDLHSALAEPRGQLDERYSRDGVHLTAAAYERWAELLAQGLPKQAR